MLPQKYPMRDDRRFEGNVSLIRNPEFSTQNGYYTSIKLDLYDLGETLITDLQLDSEQKERPRNYSPASTTSLKTGKAEIYLVTNLGSQVSSQKRHLESWVVVFQISVGEE
jgi:hypothetical protein